MTFGEWFRGICSLHEEGPSVRYFSAHGSVIELEWSGQWQVDVTGVYETRCHVGRSNEGFHPGMEIRPTGRAITWHSALQTVEAARVHGVTLQANQLENALGCVTERMDDAVETALTAVRKIVAVIENDPSQNWPKYHRDFERAVGELSRSLTAVWVREGAH